MRKVIYLDTLFLLNTVVTYILLLSVRLLGKVKTGNGRLTAASFIGGAASFIMLAPEIPAVWILLFRLVIASVISFAAFFVRDKKMYFRCFLLFFLLTLCYGGGMLLISLFLNEFVLYQNGYFYLDISFWGVILTISCIYCAILLLKKFDRSRRESFQYEIELTYDGRTVKGSALLDSGHSVTDCYNGLPVIISAESLVRRLLDEPAMNELLSFGSAPREASCPRLNIRYIPVHTVSGDRLLPAFTCSKVTVRNEDRFCTVNGASLAVTDCLKDHDGCEAIINQYLFERQS